MTKSRKRVTGGLLIALGVIAATSGPLSAKGTYDGVWSVVVAAESGTCSGAYRYPVAIVNGNVRHAEQGEQLFNIRGRVGSDGRVTVEVSSGEVRAYGVGRLFGSTGSGTWHSPQGCAGNWKAARRA